MESEQLNKSFLYLFPVIYNSIINDIKFEYEYFSKNDLMAIIKNTYSFSNMSNLFTISFKKSEKDINLDDTLRKCSFFVSSYENDDIKAYTFSIHDSFEDCYKKFINGKYSKILDEDKKLIIKFAKAFLNDSGKDSKKLINTIIQVLNKDKIRAKAMIKMFGIRDDEWDPEWEVSSMIDAELENFNY